MSVEISASTSQYTAGVFPPDEWSDKWSKQSVTKTVTTDNDLTLDSLLESSRSEKFSKGPWCKVGDFVCYGKMTGNKLRYKGVNFILLYDDQVIMKIEDPSDVDPMFNIAS